MSPLVFLLTRTFKNKALKIVRRLKNPRYLLSTLVGVAYLWFSTMGFRASPEPGEKPLASDHVRAFAEMGAVAFLVLSLLWAWAFPSTNALTFSLAEVQLLFSAPIRREALVRMKVISFQPPIVFSSLFFCFMMRRVPGLHAWAFVPGIWLIFNIMLMNKLGTSLMAVPSDAPARYRLTAILGRLAGVLFLVAIAASFRPFDPSKSNGPEAFLTGLSDWASRPPAVFVLWPFRALVHALLARDPVEFLTWLPAPLLALVVLYLWVVRTDVAFEEAAAAASERLAKRLEDIKRTGRLRGAPKTTRPAPFPLSARGNPIVALVWKNHLAESRFPVRRAAAIALFVLAAVVATAWIPNSGPIRAFLSIMPISFAGFGVLMGPEMVRNDLRTTLRSPDLLKTLPLRGWAIFLGEILAPAMFLAVVDAFLVALTVALVTGPGPSELAQIPIFPIALSVLIGLVPLQLLVLTIANGAAVCFPGWIPLGPEAQRGGPEVTGLMILLQIVRLLLLGAGLLPAAIIGGAAAFLLWIFLGPWSLPIAVALGGLAILAEVGILVALLGTVLEKLDPSVDLP